MGIHENAEHEKKGKSRRRGSTDNSKRLEAFGQPTNGTLGDWTGCSAERLQGVVDAITRLGGAVTFGLSRDKNAHMLTLLLGAEKKTLWFNGDAELDDELDAVIAKLAYMD